MSALMPALMITDSSQAVLRPANSGADCRYTGSVESKAAKSSCKNVGFHELFGLSYC